MTSKDESPGIPGTPAVPETAKDEAVTTLLRAENAHLRERVRQLEEERDRQHQRTAALQAERDTYRRAAYAWALEQIKDEDLKRYAQNEPGLPLDDFIGELEQNAKFP
jgi:hypothetical protein